MLGISNLLGKNLRVFVREMWRLTRCCVNDLELFILVGKKFYLGIKFRLKSLMGHILKISCSKSNQERKSLTCVGIGLNSEFKLAGLDDDSNTFNQELKHSKEFFRSVV